MPTEPQPVTVSEAVHRAVEVCEDSTSESLDELLARFEDDDEPITAVEDISERLDEALGPDRAGCIRLGRRLKRVMLRACSKELVVAANENTAGFERPLAAPGFVLGRANTTPVLARPASSPGAASDHSRSDRTSVDDHSP